MLIPRKMLTLLTLNDQNAKKEGNDKELKSEGDKKWESSAPNLLEKRLCLHNKTFSIVVLLTNHKNKVLVCCCDYAAD